MLNDLSTLKSKSAIAQIQILEALLQQNPGLGQRVLSIIEKEASS